MMLEYSTLSPTDLQAAVNMAKEELIEAFAREGLIQNPDDVKAKYAIVLVQRNWLGQKIASILGLSDKKGEASFKVVKLI